MTDLTQELKELVKRACSYPPGHKLRQQTLTAIIRKLDRQLWREYTPGYEDALQQTWLFFCRNICEANTGKQYDPDRGTLINWLNNHLKHRLHDLRIDEHQARKDFVPSQRQGKDGETTNVIDELPAPPDGLPLLEAMINWAQTDADGSLRATHIKGHPQANSQLLILRRLPPETSWEEISRELGIAIPTLSSFYQRKCIPQLHNFCEAEGYVDKED